MSYLVYLTLIPPILLGILLASLVILPTGRGNLLLLFSLGIPVGFGVTACLYFLWSYCLNPSFPGFWLVELFLIAVLAWYNWKLKDRLKKLIPDWKKWTWIDWSIILIFLAVFITALASFDAYTKANPHGRYDAWAIWNVRARMIARGAEHWKDVFIPQVFHADYPLLVPLTIARSWVLAGTESQRIPPAVAGLFTFASSGILPGALIALKKRQTALLAGIILLTTPWFVYFGSLQFADLPLASCILAACISLAIGLMDREYSWRWFFISSLAAGLSAWVKNEGQLFLLVFAIISAFLALSVFRRINDVKSIGSLMTGVLLPLVVILLFKLTLAPANDVVDTGNLGQTLSQLISLPRYGEVISALQDYPKGFGGWAFPLPLIFMAFWLLMCPVFSKENRLAIISLAGLLILQWIGYFLIYVITPHGLQTHINQSYDRLLMHIYPLFLFFLFLFLPPLDDLFTRRGNSKDVPAV